jgi:hypothetical protein
MQVERRQLRSTDPADAIRIFLAKNATEEGMKAAVVSDDFGILLGGVGSGDLSELAAVGSSLLDVRDPSDRARLCRDFGLASDEVHVVRLGLGTKRYVITSVGAELGAAGRLGAALDRIIASS